MMFKKFNRVGVDLLRPYTPGEDLRGVYIRPTDIPRFGGMVGMATDDPTVQWYVSRALFKKYYEVDSGHY